MSLDESIVEDAALEWFGELGYAVGHGPNLAPGEQAGGTLTPALSQRERESYSDVVLVGRLREAIRRLNPAIPEEAQEEALRKVLRVTATNLQLRQPHRCKRRSKSAWVAARFSAGSFCPLLPRNAHAAFHKSVIRENIMNF